MVSIGTPISDPPRKRPHDRTKYREIWEAVDETPSKDADGKDNWLPVKFDNYSDASKFALSCKARKHQNRSYTDLKYYQRDETVYIQGRKE